MEGTYDTAVAEEEGLFLVIQLVLIILTIVAMWKVFVKAGRPGWAVLIPMYNLFVMVEIAGKPSWLVLFFFIPIVNLGVYVIVAIALAANFGKSVLFGIGLVLIPVVCYPVLGFGSAEYRGPPA